MRVDPMMQLSEAITSFLEVIAYPSMLALAVILLVLSSSSWFEDPPAGAHEQRGLPRYRARSRQSTAQRPRGTGGALRRSHVTCVRVGCEDGSVTVCECRRWRPSPGVGASYAGLAARPRPAARQHQAGTGRAAHQRVRRAAEKHSGARAVAARTVTRRSSSVLSAVRSSAAGPSRKRPSVAGESARLASASSNASRSSARKSALIEAPPVRPVASAPKVIDSNTLMTRSSAPAARASARPISSAPRASSDPSKATPTA